LPPLAVDHVVIAVRDLDAAARAFSSFGFTLTPRGLHSIGSRNHCIMLGSTYLELLEPSSPHPWLAYYREFLHRGEGIAALALATPDAEASYRALIAHGIAARPPMDLARPVKLGEEERSARFRLVQIAPQLFLCEHQTRELVWRREWQSHANGATELTAVDLLSVPPALQVAGLTSAAQLHGVMLAPAMP
jgi:glyoxalase-like protein